MQEIYFTSDEHYGHQNALTGWGYTQPSRPWDSLEEMTEGLIERHNEYVRKGDLVYHLGDMFWRTFGVDNATKVMQRLNGQHYYILGNHEEVIKDASRAESSELLNSFIWVKDRAKIKPRKDVPSIVLDHFAGRVWNGSNRGSYQLYGHSHGRLPGYGRQMDVGVDGNNWYPVSLDSVIARIGTEKIVDTY